MIEQLSVVLIVVVAALYSLWQIAPAGLRLAALRKLGLCERPAGIPSAIERAARVPSGACAGCGARGRCPVARGLSSEPRSVNRPA